MVKVFYNYTFSTTTQTETNLQQPPFSAHEELLLVSSNASFNFFIAQNEAYYNTHITIQGQPYFTTLWRYTVLTDLPYLVDAHALVKTNKTLFYIFNCFFSNKFILYSFSNLQSTNSISHLIRGATWVERELKEFSSFTFYNLIDTRKLLTDYTVIKQKKTPLYYDLSIQEIF